MTRPFAALFALFALFAVGVAGCGGDDSTASPTKAAGTTPAASGEPTKAGGSPATAAASGAAKLPADACSLLTLQEVQTFAASASKGEDQSIKAGEAQAARCSWGPGGTAAGSVVVTVAALPFSAANSKLIFAASAKDLKENGSEVSGIGEYATLTSSTDTEATVNVIVKGLWLRVDLKGPNARAQKEKAVALAKAVVGRIQ